MCPPLRASTWLSYNWTPGLTAHLPQIRSGSLSYFLAVLLSSCVSLGRSHSLSEPRFPQLQGEGASFLPRGLEMIESAAVRKRSVECSVL